MINPCIHSYRHRKWYLIIGVIALMMCVSVQKSWAQQVGAWEVLSPRPDGQVRSGEFFLAATLTDSLTLDPVSVQLYVGSEDLSSLVKVSGRRVSVLFVGPLGFGPQQVRLVAADADGNAIPTATWGVTVVRGVPVAVSTPTVRPTARKVERVAVNGSLIADSRNASFSGLGSNLRQEPGQTNVMQFRGRMQYRGITMPVRIYATSDENRLFQPRNRYQVGIRSKYLDVYLGDNNPRYESLLINGTRVRGVEAALKLGPVQLIGIQGELQRGIEGEQLRFTSDMGFPPPNLREDSTFIVTGVYQRNIAAVRLAIGRPRTVLWGVNAMKSVDQATSIQFGENPKENVVGGTDLQIRIKRLLQLQGGAAMSVTTDDVSRGVATKAEVDSTFDIDLPFEPRDYENIIVLNASTFPIDPRGLASLAWYTRLQLRVPSNTLRAEYSSIGDAYVSFANPFIRSDRRGFYITDRFQLFNRRLNGTVRLQQYEDNLSATQLATRETQLMSVNLSALPLVQGPRLLIGYRRKDRESKDVGLPQTKDALTTLTLGANYSLNTNGNTHGINIFYTNTERTDDVNPARGSDATTFQVSLTERFHFPLTVGLRFMQLNITSNAIGTLQDQRTYGGNVRYTLLNNQLVIGVHGTVTAAKATDFFPSSQRLDVAMQSAYTLMDDLTLRLRAGISSFDEAEGDARDYTENFVFLGLTYGFRY